MQRLMLVSPISGHAYIGLVPPGVHNGIFKCDRNGNVYAGQFQGDKAHGLGEITFPNGHVLYRGAFVSGLNHGFGVVSFPNGQVYFGDCFKDTRHGYGENRFPNGDRYLGEWVNGLPHGRGRYIYRSGKAEDTFWDRGNNTRKFCNASDVIPFVERGWCNGRYCGDIR